MTGQQNKQNKKKGQSHKLVLAEKAPIRVEKVPSQGKSAEVLEEEVCSICASHYELYSTGPCNHPICHVCSLRLRALYKNNACPLCKSDIPTVIYSPKHELFDTFDLKSLLKDSGVLRGCYYVDETVKDVIHHTTSLKCPTCKDEHSNWKELKSHAKQSHSRLFCDLCTRFGHAFTWECKLYTSAELKAHQTRGDSNTSFKGHPECEFCSVRFYGNDELQEHCRKQHESCFVCARENIHNQYYNSYTELEIHFQEEHFVCKERDCLEKKFVVFGSVIDLEAHRLEVHFGGGKKKGRRVDLEFQYSDSRRRRDDPGPSEEPPIVVPETRESYPTLGNARSRAPVGFGTLSQQTPTRESSSSPAAVPEPEPSLQLTPAQNAVLDPIGGIEPQLSQLLPSSEHIKKFKKLVHSYTIHSISPENFVAQFVQLVEELHPKIVLTNTNRQTHDLITQMGSVWHRMLELFQDDPFLTERYHILQKKQKRKGLNIREFEELKSSTPMRELTLNAWNDWKVKLEQQKREKESVDIKRGWDMESTTSHNSSSSGKAKILVIKPGQAKAKKTDGLKGLTSRVGTRSTSTSVNSSIANLSLNEGPSNPPPSTSGNGWVSRPSHSVSNDDFPSLPGPSSSSRSGGWSGIVTSRPQSNPEPKRNKKGKQILMHFG